MKNKDFIELGKTVYVIRNLLSRGHGLEEHAQVDSLVMYDTSCGYIYCKTFSGCTGHGWSKFYLSEVFETEKEAQQELNKRRDKDLDRFTEEIFSLGCIMYMTKGMLERISKRLKCIKGTNEEFIQGIAKRIDEISNSIITNR